MKWKAALTVLGIAVSANLGASSTAAKAPARYDFSAIDAELSRQCRSGEFSGVVLIRAHGRDVYEKECGDADIVNHVPVTRVSAFLVPLPGFRGSAALQFDGYQTQF